MMGFLSLKAVLTGLGGLLLAGALGLAVWSYTATRSENAALHQQLAAATSARDQAIQAAQSSIETHRKTVAAMEAAAATMNTTL